MEDDSDAVGDWPLRCSTSPARDLGVAASRGRSGEGYSQHSGVVIVYDGSEVADKRIARVLWNDSRHRRDAAFGCGMRDREGMRAGDGLKLPMV